MQGKVRTTLVTVRKQGIKFGCTAVHVGFNVILHICQCKWDSKILEKAMGCLFCGQNGSFLSVLGCYLCIWDVSWLNVRTVHIVRDTMVKNACLHTDAGQKWVTIVMFPLHLGEVPLCLVTSCISSHFCHIPFCCNLLPNLENALVVARWYAMKTTPRHHMSHQIGSGRKSLAGEAYFWGVTIARLSWQWYFAQFGTQLIVLLQCVLWLVWRCCKLKWMVALPPVHPPALANQPIARQTCGCVVRCHEFLKPIGTCSTSLYDS